MNSAALPQKLRITDNVELCTVPVVALDRFRDAFASFHRHCALIDNHPIISEDVGDFARNFFDKAKIDISIWLWRRWHRDEDDL